MSQAALRTRLITANPEAIPLDAVVPEDSWRRARTAGFIIFAIGYGWWFDRKGLIIDRISVAISVGIFIIIGHLGRPLYRWTRLLIDSCCYVLMWFIYENSRGWGDAAGSPIQVQAPRNIDRFLFFGTDPNVWMDKHFYEKSIRWYESVASVTYYTHFIFPVIALAVLWVTNHHEWVRFMKRFASLLAVACLGFVLLPTVPPWMASSKYKILEPLSKRHTGRGFADLGFKGFVKAWQSALDWGNPIAAMPSLHAGFALFVPAFFLPRIRWIWLKALVLLFPIVMLASLVYFGEHYVIDGLAGWAVVGGSFWFWGWFERRQRRNRAASALAVLATFSREPAL
jgi:membrane-associated phospholipid phosphatase